MTGGRSGLILLWIVLLIGAASSAKAQTPKAQLQDTMEKVLALTRTFQSEKDFTDNKATLKQIILPRFDFAEMARRSLGNSWSALAGKEAEFVAAFVQFAEASYLNTVGSYRGEKITYDGEQVETNLAEVQTHILGPGEPVPVTYRLHLVGTEWKIYDLVIDQISLVRNFHSQFIRILRTTSVDELMRRLRAKGTER